MEKIEIMEAQFNKDERIEIRVSSLDKQMFKQAQKLTGDKTFSNFVIRILRKQAEVIINEREKVLASNRDRKIFFDAVYGNMPPNDNLVEAARKYKSKMTSE